MAEDTLCYALYKMKYGSEEMFEAVQQVTKHSDRWDNIHFGEEQWDRPPKVAPGIVCWPVETGEAFDVGLDA